MKRMVNYYLEDLIMLYPVRVKLGRGNYNYAMITLEQANQKFVAVDGCLVEQDIVPMRACDVEEKLNYEMETLNDAKDTLSICPASCLFVLEKLYAEINQAEENIAILKLAKQHYIDVEAAKAL